MRICPPLPSLPVSLENSPFRCLPTSLNYTQVKNFFFIFSCLYDVAPFISKLMLKGPLTILAHILSYLNWTDVAVYMLLCLTDLRPYISEKNFLRLISITPSEFRNISNPDLDLSHFRRVPLDRFWNSVSLAQRLFVYPTWPLSPKKLQVSAIWTQLMPTDEDGTILQISFNPRHKVVVLVHKDQRNCQFLSVHWYGDSSPKSEQFTRPMPTSHRATVSWSKKGSYLLCRIHRWHYAVVSFYKVNSDEKKLVKIQGLQLEAPDYAVSARLWISDSEFLFPGFNDHKRMTRPWVYKIEKEGKVLKIKQPQRSLRKEHPKLNKENYRGCLTSLGNGFSCQVGVCQEMPEGSSEGTAHRHSVVYFRDEKQDYHLSLSIPGLVLDAVGLPKSRVALLYRESSVEMFEPPEPCLAEDAPLHPGLYEEFGSHVTPRQSRMTNRGPFVGNSIYRFVCVSDSSSCSSSETSDETESEKDSSFDEQCASSSREKPCKHFRARSSLFKRPAAEDYKKRSKKRKRCRNLGGSNSAKETKDYLDCNLKAKPRVKNRCMIFLAVYNLETRSLELNESLAGGRIRLRGPYLEKEYAEAYSYCDELYKLSSQQDKVLQVTENLLLIHLRLSDRSINDCITLHLSNLRQGCRTARISWKCLYMHPTKNLTIELESLVNREVPILIGACTDLLEDEVCFLNASLESPLSEPTKLEAVDFVVADRDGNELDLQELRSEPAYGRAIY